MNDGDALVLTEYVDLNDIKEGKWTMQFDGERLDFDLSYQPLTQESVRVMTKKIVMGDDCVRLYIGTHRSILDDMMFDRSRKDKNPSECPGYREKGYGRWLLKWVDDMNARFQVRYCELVDLMFFLPDKRKQLSHNISPLLIALRGYSMYEDVGYLPMEEAIDMASLREQLQRVNDLMYQRMRYMTDPVNHDELIVKLEKELLEANRSRPTLERLQRKLTNNLRDAAVLQQQIVSELNAHHNTWALVFDRIKRYPNMDSLVAASDSMRTFVWFSTKEGMPSFVSDADALTVSELIRIGNITFPVSAFKLSVAVDSTVLDAVKDTNDDRLYKVVDSRVAQLGNEAVRLLSRARHMSEKREKNNATLMRAKYKMSFVRTIQDARTTTLREIVQFLYNELNNKDIGFLLSAKRLFRDIVRNLDRPGRLVKMYVLADSGERIRIVRTMHPQTGAPIFELSK